LFQHTSLYSQELVFLFEGNLSIFQIAEQIGNLFYEGDDTGVADHNE
jgi:hypothetical protein